MIENSSIKILKNNSINEEILEYVWGYLNAFLVIWLIPTVVKIVYKIKKSKYDFFSNYLRVQAFIIAFGKIFYILLSALTILVLYLKGANREILIAITIISGFLFVIIGIGIIGANIIFNLMLINRTFSLSYGKSLIVWITTTIVVAILIGGIGLFIFGDSLSIAKIIAYRS